MPPERRAADHVDPAVVAVTANVDTEMVRRYLNAAEVAELAELLDEMPRRVGVIDAVLLAAADRRGMALVLDDRPGQRRTRQASAREPTDDDVSQRDEPEFGARP